MQQAKVLVQHEAGLHARPAAQFVKLAQQFQSNITLTGNGKTVNAKSIVLVLTLAINKGTEIELKAEGEDEKEALSALVQMVERNFAET
ncbi:MAG TPA: HPr family phosphocarrier protein [Ktedonobacteraceae bacterium]